MIDLEKYTQEYWGLIRRYAYRLTGSFLDAEDVVQDTMLRAIEMGPALENIEDHPEWLHVAATEAALSRLQERKPLALDEFDLPDPVQTTGASADEATRPVEGDPDWPGVSLDFLFPIQYMSPEQRVVWVLRDSIDDGDRIAASALDITMPEVFGMAKVAEQRLAEVRKRWRQNVSFAPYKDEPKSARVFDRFLEALGLRDKVLLQGQLWVDAEVVVRGERRTGEDFVAVACTEILAQLGERLTFRPVWLNGCRGALVWAWRSGRGEWLRCATVMILNNEKSVRSLKWYLDGHILRGIEAEDPE